MDPGPGSRAPLLRHTDVCFQRVSRTIENPAPSEENRSAFQTVCVTISDFKLSFPYLKKKKQKNNFPFCLTKRRHNDASQYLSNHKHSVHPARRPFLFIIGSILGPFYSVRRNKGKYYPAAHKCVDLF